MSSQEFTSRDGFVDALKAGAAQLIVFHHLAFYGPMSDVAWPLAPALWSWLADDARLAVQVFLVVGGFLAARGLAPQGQLLVSDVVGVLWQRYIRLGVPYVAVLGVAIMASTLAGRWMSHESVSVFPSWSQLLAHVFLLQGVLGFDAMSAGVWYIAIDYQLFALLLALLWVSQRVHHLLGWSEIVGRRVALGVVVVAATASLYHFNRNPDWDPWALYFLGAYGLGAMAWWASNPGASWAWLPLMSLGASGALLVQWRSRIALALATAVVLAIVRMLRQSRCAKPPCHPVDWGGECLQLLAKSSYSLFLVHFPVCLVVNAFFVRFVVSTPTNHLVGVMLAWASSVLVGIMFYKSVELRVHGWSRRALRPT